MANDAFQMKILDSDHEFISRILHARHGSKNID